MINLLVEWVGRGIAIFIESVLIIWLEAFDS